MGVFKVELGSDEDIDIGVVDTVVFMTVVAVVGTIEGDFCCDVPGIAEFVSSLKSHMCGEVVGRFGIDRVFERLGGIAIVADIFNAIGPSLEFIFLKAIRAVVAEAYDADEIELAVFLVFEDDIGEVDQCVEIAGEDGELIVAKWVFLACGRIPTDTGKVAKLPVGASYLRADSCCESESECWEEPLAYTDGEAGAHVGEEIACTGVFRHGVTDADLCEQEDVVRDLVVVEIGVLIVVEAVIYKFDTFLVLACRCEVIVVVSSVIL